jgi:hypothetical protein
MSSRYNRPGLVGPVLLIGLGILFLLENLGMLAWNIWEVAFRLWPLLLVAWGLELMVGRRSAWGAAVALILMLLILVGGVYMLSDSDPPSASTIEVDVPLGEAREAQVTLDPAFAYLKLQSARHASQLLLEGRAAPIRGEHIDQEIERSGRRVEATIRTTGVMVVPLVRMSGDHASWDMQLHPGVDYDLIVDVGAGKTDLFLADLVMKVIDVDTGIGQTIVHLPDHGEYDAKINGGLGHVVIYLPDDLGVKLFVDMGIGGIDVPNDFRRQGGAYVSPNYNQAEETIEVDVSLGIGSIEIR